MMTIAPSFILENGNDIIIILLLNSILLTLKRQFYKVVKHTQNNSWAICQRIVWVCLTILWDWCLKG